VRKKEKEKYRYTRIRTLKM